MDHPLQYSWAFLVAQLVKNLPATQEIWVQSLGWEERASLGASLIAQLVEKPPAVHETLVQFLGWEDLLEKNTEAHSSILGLPWWLSW